ncbi:MAG: tRNA (guanosine(46)-N7)-methyltransferase TrmB [Deltaproteobacteria bacterium]|nr:tRNA (guanosine(46)-N7)-methyltransferase TrmB [Deltaproteobacteria bacterium]
MAQRPWHPAVAAAPEPATLPVSGISAHEFWGGVFGRVAPVEVEIGAGRGAFLFAAAVAAPDRNFFAIENSSSHAVRLRHEAEARGLANVRVLRADATCVVASLIPAESVAAYHVYFPDPWWKRRHHRRRLFTAAFAAALARTLIRGGRLYFATDVAPYFGAVTALLAAQLEPDDAPRPLAVVTRFEHKALSHGSGIHSASFRRPLL